jgi:hypothetical protein
MHGERPLWVVSGPSELYHPDGRYRVQSGRQNRWNYWILTSAFGQKRTLVARYIPELSLSPYCGIKASHIRQRQT